MQRWKGEDARGGKAPLPLMSESRPAPVTSGVEGQPELPRAIPHLASGLLACACVDRDGSFSQLLKASSPHHSKQIKPGKAGTSVSPETACLDLTQPQSTPGGFLHLTPLSARSSRAGRRQAGVLSVHCLRHGSDGQGTSPALCPEQVSGTGPQYRKLLGGLAGFFSSPPSPSLPCPLSFPAAPVPAPRLPAGSRAGSSTMAQGMSSPPGSCDSVVLSPEAARAHHAAVRAGAACQAAGEENGGNGSEFAACISVSTPLCWAVSTIAK